MSRSVAAVLIIVGGVGIYLTVFTGIVPEGPGQLALMTVFSVALALGIVLPPDSRSRR